MLEVKARDGWAHARDRPTRCAAVRRHRAVTVAAPGTGRAPTAVTRGPPVAATSPVPPRVEVPAPAAAPRRSEPASTAPASSRPGLFKEIAALYAAALEYPEEVFTENVALEAELGVDSVKQTELLGRMREKYRLPPRPEDFRLARYDTLGKITDYVLSEMSRAAVPA